MVDTRKLMVRVEREIPYSKITMREKIRLAEQTEREDLLEAVAMDKSLKVRLALIDRVREIPDRILGEYLLKDDNEDIREKARKRIISEKLSSNYYGKDGINIVLLFLCKFFNPEFVLNLNSYGNKRRAMSAIYLYFMKYGCRSERTNSKLQIFHKIFNQKEHNSRNTNLWHILTGDQKKDEPWETDLWKILEKLANYRYVPEQINVVLGRNLLSSEVISNINILKLWCKQTVCEPENDDLSKQWVNILAKTLYNLGEPLMENNSRTLAKCRLILEGGVSTELANAAEEALKEIFDTSAEKTYYTKTLITAE